MTASAIFTLIVILFMVIALALDFIGPDYVLFLSLIVLMISGIITPEDAFQGFANKGVITIAALFIVSKAVENTGAINFIAEKMLSIRKERGLSYLMLRMMLPVSALSAFLNNTPIVVMFAPRVKKWADNLNLPASKFLIPLSYATIFGGVCTLIGTSTNLVVHAQMIEYGMEGLSMFELAMVGIPAALIGLAYLAIFGKRVLPERKDSLEKLTLNKKEYMIELLVKRGCALIGKTIKETGLFNLNGLYSIEIIRRGTALNPVAPTDRIQERDRLLVFGQSSAILEVSNIPFLIPINQRRFKKDYQLIQDQLVETVISPMSPFIGKTIRKCDFERQYGATVVAIHRNGERIKSRIKNVRLKIGDSLLLQTSNDFVEKWRGSQDFYLISHIQTVYPEDRLRTIIAFSILTLMVVGASIGQFLPELAGEKLGMLHFAVIAAILLIITRCVKIEEARKSLRLDVLITIAAAFGISNALINTGAASVAAHSLIEPVESLGPVGVLAVVYLVTNLFTEIVTNNAAAVLMSPIAFSAATQIGADPRPFLVAVAIAASASFSTPIGYQTNLIVQGIGGYKFKDYFKVGLPLNIIFFILSILLIPLFWSF